MIVNSGSTDELVTDEVLSASEMVLIVWLPTAELVMGSTLETVLVVSLSTAELVIVLSVDELTVLVSTLAVSETVLELEIESSREVTFAKSVPTVETASPEIALKYTHSEALASKDVPTH